MPGAGAPPPFRPARSICTWLVGMVLTVLEPSLSSKPVRLSASTSRVAVTVALLPKESPSLISLWGAPAGGV
ncbi:hypothetical protein D9M70_646910 [compost metagenome]